MVKTLRADRPLNILVGCEESQAVTIEFRKLGHNAFSCDLEPCSGGHPEWHLQADVFKVIDALDWDMGLFFPPCTYLTISANKWYADDIVSPNPETLTGAARDESVDFFLSLHNSLDRVVIENPIGVMSTRFRKPDQVLQPWMFGHGETKATCLWLKGLPLLQPTDIVSGREQRLHKLPPSKDRALLRSKTFPGIAKALAEQYSQYLLTTANHIRKTA